MTDKEKLRKLADAMYYAAQQLTTDASRLHKAMEDYHQFIVNDYHEEDPVSAEVWISTDDDVKNAAEKTTRRFCKISLLSGDYLSLAEAQPQVNKESKLIAIKSFVCGAQWDRNKLMKEAKLYGWVARDENGSLHLFEEEPRRIEDGGLWWDRDYNCTTLDKNDFPDLEWEDEPVYVKLIILKEE